MYIINKFTNMCQTHVQSEYNYFSNKSLH